MSQKLLPWKIALPNPGVATGGTVTVGDLDISSCVQRLEFVAEVGKPVRLVIILVPGALEIEGNADTLHPLFIEQTAIGDTCRTRGRKSRMTAEQRQQLDDFLAGQVARMRDKEK